MYSGVCSAIDGSGGASWCRTNATHHSKYPIGFFFVSNKKNINKITKLCSALTINGPDGGTVPVRLRVKNLLFVDFVVAVAILAAI